jgi:iron complex transport system substrate-binding protein
MPAFSRNRKFFPASLIALGLGLALTLWLRSSLAARFEPPPIPANPQRIVSLAPSVTETFFALGLGDRVVGRTRYCEYPPEALKLPAVGSFSELSLEAVARLRPDLVAIPSDRLASIERLRRLGLATFPLDTRSLAGFRQAVADLGQKLNREPQAGAILANIGRSLAEARRKSQGRPRPRVLFSVMHGYEGLGYISEINAVGRDGFYDQVLAAAGGDNAYQGPLAFPRLSRESIIFLNPDVIVDVLLETESLESARRDWLSLGPVKAARDGRVHFLTQASDTVPGPRIYLTIDRLSGLFHPSPGPGAP